MPPYVCFYTGTYILQVCMCSYHMYNSFNGKKIIYSYGRCEKQVIRHNIRRHVCNRLLIRCNETTNLIKSMPMTPVVTNSDEQKIYAFNFTLAFDNFIESPLDIQMFSLAIIMGSNLASFDEFNVFYFNGDEWQLKNRESKSTNLRKIQLSIRIAVDVMCKLAAE